MRPLVGCCLFLGSTLLAAEVPTIKPTSPGPDALVQQLGDAQFRLREEAMKQLLERGESAIPALTAALAHPQLEVRSRAESLLEKIRRQVDTLKQAAPKLIKLDYQNKPLSFVVADFKTKSGLPIVLELPRTLDNTRLVTVTTPTPVSPWEALEALLQQAGLQESFREEVPSNYLPQPNYTGYNYYGGPMIQRISPNKVPIWLVNGQGPKLSADRSSALRVAVLPVNYSGHRLIRGSGQLQLIMDVTPSAELGWDETLNISLTRAEDETGRPVTISHRPISNGMLEVNDYDEFGGFRRQALFLGNGGYYYGYQPSNTIPNTRLSSIVLRTDDRPMKKLKLFEGVVTGQILLQNQVLGTFDDLSKLTGKAIELQPEYNISVVSYVVKPDGKTHVKVRQEMPNPWRVVRFGGPWGGGMQTTASTNRFDQPQLKYFDAQGKALPNPYSMGSMSTSDGIRQTTEVEWVFNKATTYGPPVKLVVMGTKTKSLDIPFRMTDVVLP